MQNEKLRLEKGRLLIMENNVRINTQKHRKGEEYVNNTSFIICSTILVTIGLE